MAQAGVHVSATRFQWATASNSYILRTVRASAVGTFEINSHTRLSMAAQNALPGLLPEILHDVIESLSFEDVTSLRLVCRQLGWKVIGRRYRGFFERKTTNLTRESLSSLEALGRHGALGRLVRHIRVVAEAPAILSAEKARATRKLTTASPADPGETVVVDLTEDQLRQTEDDLAWMRAQKDDTEEAEVLELLARIFSWGITTVELDARFVEGPGKRYSRPAAPHIVPEEWQALWVRASQVYRLTMTAVSHSGSMPKLNIYGNTLGCSVPSYDVNVILPSLLDAGFETAGASVDTLVLSFSTRVDHGWRGWDQAYGVQAGKAERERQRRQWDDIFEERDYVTSDEEGDGGEHRDDGLEGAAEPGEDEYDEEEEEEDDGEFDKTIEEAKGSEIRGRYGDNMAQVLCRDNFPGVARLLLHMRNLRSLDLHMYQTLEYESYGGGSRLHSYYRVFGALDERAVVLSRLRRLVLRGLYVRPADLASFVRAHRLEDVELRDVMLAPPSLEGTSNWAAVLKDVFGDTSDPPARLYLKDLGSVHQRANLIRPGEALLGEWVDRGWGSACPCGEQVRLWTRELSAGEMKKVGCFEFARAGRQRCRCRDPAVSRSHVRRAARVWREVYGGPC